MKFSQKTLSEISQITREIEEKYPELQKYLDENPMTLSGESNIETNLDNKGLKDYLNSLKELVKHYKKEH